MNHVNRFSLRYFVAAAMALGTVLVSATPGIAEPIEIVIPLEQGEFYQPDAVRQQLQEKLGIKFPPMLNERPRCRLGRDEKAALLAADLTGILDVKFFPDRIQLNLPQQIDPNDVAKLLKVEWGLMMPEDFDPKRPTVVLIHGLESTTKDVRKAAIFLESKDVQVLLFEYPNDGPVATAARRLSEQLKGLKGSHPGTRVAILAHSMGGLVARYCLEMPGQDPGCINRIVMLGTPHGGSNMAKGQKWLELANSVGVLLDRKWTIVNDGQGEAAVDLTPGSPLLQQLSRRQRTANVHYACVVGTKAYLTEKQQAESLEELRALLARRSVPEAKRHAILSFVASPELCHGKGDGAVTIENATLSGADVVRHFPRTHLQMLDFSTHTTARQLYVDWVIKQLGILGNAESLPQKHD